MRLLQKATATGLAILISACAGRGRESAPLVDNNPIRATFSATALNDNFSNPSGFVIDRTGLWQVDSASPTANLVVPDVVFFDRKGDNLVYARPTDGNSVVLYQGTLGFSNEQVLTSYPVVYNLALSRDGTVAVETPTGIEIVAKDPYGGTIKRVLTEDKSDREYTGKPRWTSDGNLVIQHIDWDKGIDTLEVIDLQTGDRETLANTDDVNFFDVDAEGNIVYSSVATGSIMFLEKGSTLPRPIRNLVKDMRGGARVDFADKGRVVFYQTPGVIGRISLDTMEVNESPVNNAFLHDIKAP